MNAAREAEIVRSALVDAMWPEQAASTSPQQGVRALDALLGEVARLEGELRQERAAIVGKAIQWRQTRDELEAQVARLEAREQKLAEALADDLRWATEVLTAAAPSRLDDEGHYANRALTYLGRMAERLAR